MTFQGMNMAMGMQMNAMNYHNGEFMGGMSDTGAAPDNSGGSMINMVNNPN